MEGETEIWRSYGRRDGNQERSRKGTIPNASSSSFSHVFSPPARSSPYSTPLEENEYENRRSCYFNELLNKVLDSISEDICKIQIRDEKENVSEFGDRSLNVEQHGRYEGINGENIAAQGFASPPLVSTRMSSDSNSASLGLQQLFNTGNSTVTSYPTPTQPNGLNSLSHLINQSISLYDSGPYHSNTVVADSILCGARCNGGHGVIEPSNFVNLKKPQALNLGSPLRNYPTSKERTTASPDYIIPRSVAPILQGNNSNREGEFSRAHKRTNGYGCVNTRGDESLRHKTLCRCSRDSILQRIPQENLTEFLRSIYTLAKDQNGCRSLQRIFEEGNCRDIELIYNEIVVHVVELMVNPFGNYLMQKLLDVCNDEQRTRIVFIVTKEAGALVRISLNTYGTRVVQKLIETIKTRREISMVTTALERGFIELIKDINGNHVINRCLQCFSNEDNEFIFEAAAEFCIHIGTQRHGCVVLQRCIEHSAAEYKAKLLIEVARNALLLAQDPFGNYVVQFIIELKIPPATEKLLSQFKGNYVLLSTQKFSSHVVEKCLEVIEEIRPHIIHELISFSNFELLLQDPYGNYVIKKALDFSRGPLHASIVKAIQPHSTLRTNPHCKRIFSSNLLKK